jgi:putative ABC transport system permease protein
MSPNGPRPPRFLVLLARLLLVGEQGRHIREDLEESFARDLEKQIPSPLARRRYTLNLLGSVWSFWTGWFTGTLARGATLDAKLGLRMLAKQPMLTGVAILALGLGIPASLATRHVLGVFQGSLPVPEGERVMGIRNYSLENDEPLMSSVHDYARWREAGLVSFQSIAAARSYGVSVHAGDPGAPPVKGADMSASAFEVLRATPLMGRLLGTADEVRGAPDVVLLGENVWRSRFGSDPEIIGRSVRIGRVEHTVVGVMPSSFRFPMGDEVWLPLRASPVDYPDGEGPGLRVFGRLADGVTAERAALEVAQLTERLAVDDPQKYARWIGEAVPMSLLLLGEEENNLDNPEFLLVQAVSLALLLIVCGNVGTLILARTATRLGELSIRTALGASRTRIVSQLFIEALVLALVAAGLGLFAAEMTARWFMGKVAPLLPYWMDFGLRPDTVLVAVALSVLAAVVAGVLPAFRATSRSVQPNLQHSATAKGSVRFGLGSSLLIVSEVVLSVGFLAMGGTLVRSVFQDTEGKLGMEPARYLRADVNVPWIDPALQPEYADEEAFQTRLRQTQQEVLRRLSEAQAVRGVGLGIDDLAAYGPDTRDIVLEGREAEGTWDASTVAVDVGFFRGLGRPVLAGRDFSVADVEVTQEEQPTPVIVNTSFVEQVLGGRNAVGQRFRLETPEQGTAIGRAAWFEIVGVVGPFGLNPINPVEDAGFYEPLAPGASNPARYLVEVDGDPASFAPRLREIVAAVDAEATVEEAVSLEEIWEIEQGFIRGMFFMEVVLAGVAFVLAVSGLYALMSFTVSQRTREVAIRSALGARPWSIVSTIARRTAIQLGIGLALGGVWAWVLLSQIVDDPMILQINKPVTVAATLLITALVGAIGCASPTIRGLRIQPSEALRES